MTVSTAKVPTADAAKLQASSSSLATTLVALREAMSSEDWPRLRQLWAKLPPDFQSSSSGQGVRAALERGTRNFEEAAALYFRLYKAEGNPHYLSDAILCSIDAKQWHFAELLTEYLVQRVDHSSILPEFLGKLPAHIRLDELYIYHSCMKSPLPACLMDWNEPETRRLRKALVDCVASVVRIDPTPKNISALSTVAVSLNEEALALERLRDLRCETGAKWLHIANLNDQMDRPADATKSYLKTMDADSTLDEVVPLNCKNGTPFVLLHRGPAAFVEYALRSLRYCHPERRIILITDDFHRYDPEIDVEYRQWAHYNATAKHLAKIYKHCSENRYAFELLCLERWLILDVFCKQEAIERIIHLDTDILSFGDFSEIESTLEVSDSATCGTSPHVAVMNQDAIKAMADCIIKFYEGEFEFPTKREGSNISDMNFIAHLASVRGWKNLHELELVEKVDHHLRSSNGYQMVNGLKHFDFVHGKPIATHLEDGQRDHFLCIHFQGPSKKHMIPYFQKAFKSP